MAACLALVGLGLLFAVYCAFPSKYLSEGYYLPGQFIVFSEYNIKLEFRNHNSLESIVAQGCTLNAGKFLENGDCLLSLVCSTFLVCAQVFLLSFHL